MEVAADTHKLVLSQRKGRNIVNLIADNDTGAYFIHHLNRGHLIAYDNVGSEFSAASTAYYTYLKMLD